MNPNDPNNSGMPAADPAQTPAGDAPMTPPVADETPAATEEENPVTPEETPATAPTEPEQGNGGTGAM